MARTFMYRYIITSERADRRNDEAHNELKSNHEYTVGQDIVLDGLNWTVEKVEVIKPINRQLSLKGCWKMVNAIQNGDSPEEIRGRCAIAQKWLNANDVISNDEYDELMMAVTLQHRESYHLA